MTRVLAVNSEEVTIHMFLGIEM